MSFGIVVLSHTCTLTPHQGEDHQHKLQLESDSASIQLQHAQGSVHPLMLAQVACWHVRGCIPLQLLYYNRKSTSKECGEKNKV